MLNTFVLPVGKFAAAAPYLSSFDLQHSLRISALGGKSESKSDFEHKLSEIVAAIRELQSRNGEVISVTQLEIALPPDCDLSLLRALCLATEGLGLRIFCEAPPGVAEKTIALLAQVDTSGNAPLGYKLRTGGVTADAFPSSDEIATALVAAGRDHVVRSCSLHLRLSDGFRLFRCSLTTLFFGIGRAPSVSWLRYHC